MNKNEIIEKLYRLSEDTSLETAIFQQQAAANAGLNVSDMRALSVIMKNGSTGPSALSKKLRLTNGAVTGIIKRLSEKNLITITPVEGDERKYLVSANYTEIMKGGEAYQKIGEEYTALLQQFSLEELKTILKYNELTLELTKKQSADMYFNN